MAIYRMTIVTSGEWVGKRCYSARSASNCVGGFERVLEEEFGAISMIRVAKKLRFRSKLGF